MSKTGYIYKLCCNDPEITDCYVGSTKNEKVRKNNHKVRCNGGDKYHNLNVYQFIRSNGGWGNWNMVRLEEFKFNERAQLNARERHWLETLGATLNELIPTRTKKEYYEEHKEVLAERQKEYRDKNKEKLSEKKKVYREANKEKIAEKSKVYREANHEVLAEKSKVYREENKEVISQKQKESYYGDREERLKKVKEYHEANKEVIAGKQKEYYEANREEKLQKFKKYYEATKEKIAEKGKIKITCECGTILSNFSKSKHLKSKKHKDYIISLDCQS